MADELTLQTIDRLEAGLVSDAFNDHLANAVKDCMRRATDPRPRKVTLTVAVEPEMSDGGPTGCLTLDAQVLGKLPAHQSVSYQCTGNAKTGVLKFNAEDPGSVHQTTLPGTRGVADAVARQNAKGGKT